MTKSMEQMTDAEKFAHVRTKAGMAIAWYAGHDLTPTQYPADIHNWDVTTGELTAAGYGASFLEQVFAALAAGKGVRMRNRKAVPVTLYAVLKPSRPLADLYRAGLQAGKALGTA